MLCLLSSSALPSALMATLHLEAGLPGSKSASSALQHSGTLWRQQGAWAGVSLIHGSVYLASDSTGICPCHVVSRDSEIVSSHLPLAVKHFSVVPTWKEPGYKASPVFVQGVGLSPFSLSDCASGHDS